METKMDNLTISLPTAKKWAKTWQSMNSECAKAYLIPIDDLISAFLEMGIVSETTNGTFTLNPKPKAAIRCYLGTNPDPNERSKAQGYGNKMYIVGTNFERGKYKDIILGERETAAIENENLEGTGIFDFTKPCPNNCDEDSPLFND